MVALRIATVAALLAALMVLAAPAMAQQNGQQLYMTKGCVACHGPEGKSPIQPNYARLAGQQADYIVVQLKAFKAQERTSGLSQQMWPMAATLNEEEMRAIAEYLESLGG